MEAPVEGPFIIRHFTSITRIVGLFTSAGKAEFCILLDFFKETRMCVNSSFLTLVE